MSTDLAAELEPHIPSLRRYARTLTRNADAADDLVQDCLERAVARWHLHRRDTSTQAWLLAITRNIFLNDMRRSGRKGMHVEYSDDGGHASLDVGADRILMGHDALAILQGMSEEDRSLLLLVGVEDLSYRETALVFGVPEGTIMSRLSRARARLRALLESGGRVALRRVK